MNHPKLTILRSRLGRKLAVLILLAVSGAGAFATLGDGRKKASSRPNNSFLSGRTGSSNYFTLRSGYSYKGSQVLNSSADKKYVSLNTFVTIQKGNNTYVLPLKKKAVLDKVKIDLSNRQFKRN
jgi:hypothetical protein